MDIFERVIRRTRKELRSISVSGRSLDRSKKIAALKVKIFDRNVSSELRKMYKVVPDFSKIHPFFRELISAHVTIDEIRMKLGRIRSVLPVLASIRDEALYDIRRAGSKEDVRRAVRKYFGRVNSVLRRIKGEIEFSRDVLRCYRELPKISLNNPIVVIAGYPNVGKSTLLRAITGSEPRIAPYPFTTKKIMIGHAGGIQFLDTPGILDRPVSRMKPPEKLALAAVRYADAVIFVLDPTQPIDPQEDLLRFINKEINVPVIVAVNKTDIVEYSGKGIRISALTGYGVDELIKSVHGVVKWKKYRTL